MCNKITAIIVTYNPDIYRLEKVISAVSTVSDSTFIIDNNSADAKQIKEVIGKVSRADINFVELGRNIGVAGALNTGLDFLTEKNGYVLTMDQDSILLISRNELEQMICDAKKISDNNFGALSLSHSSRSSNNLSPTEIPFTIISGMVIDISLFHKGLKYREDFFMDQVDFDLCYNIRHMDKRIFITSKKTMDHMLGTRVTRFGQELAVEPDWRIYLLLRNSTILLRERKIGKKFYLGQILFILGERILGTGFGKNIRLPKVIVSGLYDGLTRHTGDNFKFY
ncbi:glycosyltransferase [Ferroplasma acidiphilum]|uniref:glycosyltransferase n=1 Tax=Ferroplasma acidiphilum TaxID=74969 RepID=UPI002814D336|nr:glycosyltransferase [Ferroplasma acidiphilum]WMT53762.1 MAG: glycosyltransferase [Ferroplasma acidiphilum]